MSVEDLFFTNPFRGTEYSLASMMNDLSQDHLFYDGISRWFYQGKEVTEEQLAIEIVTRLDNFVQANQDRIGLIKATPIRKDLRSASFIQGIIYYLRGLKTQPK